VVQAVQAVQVAQAVQAALADRAAQAAQAAPADQPMFLLLQWYCYSAQQQQHFLLAAEMQRKPKHNRLINSAVQK
jgi:hypothetical protein